MDQMDIIVRMSTLAEKWEQQKDNRAIFLHCYCLMTKNMVHAIEDNRFMDRIWVDKLLHRFADYYFEAIACFECGEEVPKVWQVVHEAADRDKLHVLQHLFLGVNAHINYDLVLTLNELLQAEWNTLSQEERETRYQDHRLVNTIIGETIDQVQDEVVESRAPYMDLIDKAMGRLDEKLIVDMISNWRKSVWENALLLLNSSNEEEKRRYLMRIEEQVLRNAKWLKF